MNAIKYRGDVGAMRTMRNIRLKKEAKKVVQDVREKVKRDLCASLDTKEGETIFIDWLV